MRGLRYTLLADGTSDRMLLEVIDWAVRRRAIRIEQNMWADLSFVHPKPVVLADRVRHALAVYPCDVLFVHRDAEKTPAERRHDEITHAMTGRPDRHVAIVPVRMTEAWFLHDAAAIRMASGNPRGRVALDLPAPNRVEGLPDPKESLFGALLTATELTGRRREHRKRELPRMRARVAQLIDDFDPLIGIPSFDRFLADLDRALNAWASVPR